MPPAATHPMLILDEIDPNPYRAPESDTFKALDVQVSADGAHCPACDRDVGVVAIVRASMPDRIYCPYCGARLEYLHAEMLWTAVIVILLALLVLIGYSLTWMSVNPVAAVASLFGVGAVWLPVEFAAARYLRRYKRLKTVSARKAPGRSG